MKKFFLLFLSAAALAANQTGEAKPVTFQVAGKKARTATLPANSLNTFVF